MAAPVIQFKRGAYSGITSFRAGEPAFTTDTFDFFIGLDNTLGNNKFFGSHRYWTRETGSSSLQLNLVDKDGTNKISIKSPDTLSGVTTYTLPETPTNAFLLTTDADGVLSWTNSLQGLGISGITTFTDTTDNTLGNADTGAVQIDGGLGVNKNLTVGANLDVQGYSNFVGVVTFKGGTINLGDDNTDDINVAGEFISNLNPNTDDTYDIGISGKRWRNANFAGVGTFATGAVIDNLQIGISSTNEIDTSSGNLTLDSAGGQVIIDDNLSVSGVSTFTGNVSFGSSALFSDNDKISLGSDNDFDIYFDGSNTYLTNKSTNGASDLYIQSDEILLRRYDGGQTMAQFTEGGSVKLNYAGVTKIQTTSYGAVVSNELVATSLNASGLSTFSNTVVGGATTEMVVGGNLRVTGVTTVGILTSTEPAEIDGIKISGKGSTNVFIGQDAGRDHSSAQQCVALGWNALAENTNSNFNTAVGLQALGNLGQNTGSSYSSNTAVGHLAGSALETGFQNTLIGAIAGNEITSGSNNTLVGRYDGNNSDLDIRTSSNNVVLSDGEGNIRFYANSSGDVGIGTAEPTSKLDIVGDVNVSGVVTATSFSGDGSALTGISAGVTTSHTNVQVAWSVTANGTSAFRFAGPGNDGAEDNPDLYLVRGQRYRFTNNSGGSHPFEIRSSPGGSAFSDGVTNNAAASGNIDFNVQHDAPNRLYYQCTNHAGMLGNIYILRQNAFGNGGFNELDAALFN